MRLTVRTSSDTIASRDLPQMRQGELIQVTQEQYDANRDILTLVKATRKKSADKETKKIVKPSAE